MESKKREFSEASIIIGMGVMSFIGSCFILLVLFCFFGGVHEHILYGLEHGGIL